MQEQIKDLKKSEGEAVKGGSKRKAEEEEEEARERSPVKKSLMVSDDDDEVECVVIEEDKTKEIEIKRALRLMITQPPKNNLEVTTVPESPMSNSEEAKVADSSTIGLDVTAVSESQDIKMEETNVSEFPEVNCEDTKVTEGLDKISDEQNISEPTSAPLKVIVKCEFKEETIFDLGEVKPKATARVTRSQTEESALSKSLEAVENGPKDLVKNKPEVEHESLPSLSSEENKFAEKAIIGNGVSDPCEVTNILEEEEKAEKENIVEEEIMQDNNHEKDTMKDTIGEGQNVKRDNIAEEEEEIEKHVDLEMSWQLRKWPSLPSVLSRSLFHLISSTLSRQMTIFI